MLQINRNLMLTIVVAGLFVAPALAAPITIQNSSFEQTEVPDKVRGWNNITIPNWTAIGGYGQLIEGYLSAPDAPDGTQWLYINGNATEPRGAWQNVGTLDTTQVYQLSLIIAYSESTSGGTFIASLYTDDGTNHTPTILLAENVATNVLLDAGTTAPLSATYDATAHPEYDGQALYVRIAGTSTNSARMLFDNVSLTAIPEPASLSILALGAIGLLARRRKATLA